MPTCRECKTSFSIATEDKKILNALELPEPTLCATDAHRRRMTYRNEASLYRRQCELCKKNIIAMYSPASYAHVYCRPCWYSDQWDPMKYAQTYDPQKPFFEQLHQLLTHVPHYNLWQPGENVNSEYVNYVLDGKDCYLVFSGLELENIVYSRNIDWSKDCADGLQVYHSELVYDCVYTYYSYRSAFLTRAYNCNECYLGRDLTDCQNCFGCVNLKHKKFYWFNESLPEVEYRKRLTEALKNRESFEEHRKRFAQHSLKFPVEFAIIRKSENVVGEAIESSKNIRLGFNMIENENCGECFRMLKTKDCYRVNHTLGSQNSYEVNSGIRFNSAACSYTSPDCMFIAYCFFCENSDHLFGCVGLRGKRFCILNQQYSETKYHDLRKKIINKMRDDGEWGEFLPVQYSPHTYNETMSQDYFPLTKKKVLVRGWRWQDESAGLYGKETLRATDIHSQIEKVAEIILEKILACVECKKNYRIQSIELKLLKLLHLPLPLLCPACRFQKRWKRHYPLQLYHRQCQCDLKHSEHSENRCPTEFETTYAPERPEKIFCNPCYQQEIL
ncbi:MAG: hypothetical protein A3B74_00080 [Candidatus Kerfeldbacteria bacterium RIFCSPHIGHO2_02_FULL_42_14]|uniref:Caib/baif family protein n=1 Tax=Candidatus Kerfeldbacteria bacterium RIFCSPHIGHO2_02_FULL_42_14 TaxID=1798540 RepID=A0A1G2AT93_9BACT|nr:MAG: hypothetical protein A3B74_00080 [Candidatus Kerfeldbacteria bacterium RIFCSPHIGHO2_02_FULL_42_14]OGY81325.1 MAG: hypothetical protein A3E60_02660 [Candidatus Kerfeldbacteria bacterium RIFCSPHIGHO2_12_FULL_42_13]OGY83599.1 MAG: hypothetical protein A3I91_03090 [Candidatus Kerfeldbacteria bacterium RIFCSPLOWO2_02_FULL_42_19]OGY86687.1 MAG: hypothetical protein A3G01_00535 [Candidatus Kerfeldbacteria bacterium RIFCSPLOWO2_12_FULL_43_9]